MIESTDISRYAGIHDLIRVYATATADIREAFAKVTAAEKALNEAFVMGAHGWIRIVRGNTVYFDDPERHVDHVRRDVWAALIERSQVRRAMSSKRWRELQQQIEKGDMPEPTLEVVEATLRGLFDAIPEMLQEAVHEVFDWLRPHEGTVAAQAKRNSQYEVPRRVLLTGIVERWSMQGGGWRVNHHRQQNMAGLENVFLMLDGKARMETVSYLDEVSAIVNAKGYSGSGESTYFRFRTYKNGNLHLYFKREDLLAKFNQIAGGMRLRPQECA